MPWLPLCSRWGCMMRCKPHKRSCPRATGWLPSLMYITTRAPRARAALESVAGKVARRAGVQTPSFVHFELRTAAPPWPLPSQHASPVTALDSSQCMPEINHPSSQAANRQIFTSCVPAIDSAFCDCIVTCHLSRAPTCMHDSQVRVSRRPAYSGPRKHSSRRRPQMQGTHRCCSLAHFSIVPAGPLAFC